MADINTVFRITASVAGSDAVKQLNEELKRVSTNGETFKRSFAQGAMMMAKFAAGASVAVGGLAAMAMRQIDLADNMNDISQRTGVAVEQLAKYSVAASNSGTSLEALAGSFNKLNKNLVSAQSGTGDTADALKAMGISLKDANGQLKNADQITTEVADLFARFPDGPQKAALAVALFGKSGTDLIPMLNMGSEAIKEMGLSIDTEFAQASDNFNDYMGGINRDVSNLATQITKGMMPALADGVKSLSDMFATEADAKVFGKAVGDVFRVIVVSAAFVVSSIKQIIAVVKGLGTAATGVGMMATGDFAGGKAMVGQALETYKEDAEAAANAFLKTYRENLQNSNLFGDGGVSAAAAAARAGAEAAAAKPPINSTVLNNMTNFNPTSVGGADKAAREMERATAAAKEWIAKQRESIETLRMESEYIGRTTNEIEQMKDARQIMTEAQEKAANLSGEAKERFLREAEAIAAMRKEVIQYNYEANRTFGAGARSFLTKYAEDAANTAEQVKTALTTAFKGAEDALVSFTTTGALDFRTFAQSVISDLARIAIQRSITGPLASVMDGLFSGFTGGTTKAKAFASGGIMTDRGPVPLRAYASGGIANSPQMALFGEGSMPEAYVPLPDGRRIPVAMQGGGGSNVNVVVNMTTGATQTTSTGNDAAKLGNMIAASVKSILINEKRPGGLLAAM